MRDDVELQARWEVEIGKFARSYDDATKAYEQSYARLIRALRSTRPGRRGLTMQRHHRRMVFLGNLRIELDKVDTAKRSKK